MNDFCSFVKTIRRAETPSTWGHIGHCPGDGFHQRRRNRLTGYPHTATSWTQIFRNALQFAMSAPRVFFCISMAMHVAESTGCIVSFGGLRRTLRVSLLGFVRALRRNSHERNYNANGRRK